MTLAASAPAARPRPEAATVWVWLETGAALLVLLFLTDVWVGLVVGHDPTVPTDHEALRRMWFPIYGVIALLAVTSPTRFGSVWPGVLLGAPLVVLAFVSSQWSIDSDVTTRRAIALAFTTMFGFYLAARYSWRGFVELVAGALLVAALGSLVAALLFPSFGVDHEIHAGAWRGLYSEKNSLGAMMARGALAAAAAAILAPQRRLLWIGAGLLSAGMVIASTSTTALFTLLLIAAMLPVIMAVRTGGALGVGAVWATLTGAAAVVAATVFMPDLVFGAFGKDATLTGRTDIWELVMENIRQRPLLGHGFGAFWSDPNYGPSAVISSVLEWPVPNAHNGWLETLLAFGMVGLVLVAVHMAVALGVAMARLPSEPDAYWSLPFLAIFLVSSLSESSIIQQNSLAWALYVATAAKLLQTRVFQEPAPRARAPLGVEHTTVS